MNSKAIQQTDWVGPIARLRRITTSGKYIAELDGLRFLAIMWVVLLHVELWTGANFQHLENHKNSWVLWFVKIGTAGVPLFFVISGFILGLPFAEQHLENRKPVSLRQYYVRRLSRLEPPYIIVMTFCFVVQLIKARWTAGVLTGHYTASLFYLHNIIYQGASILNTPAWSLEIEAQFYILAPLLAQIFRLSVAFRRALMVAAIIFSCAIWPAIWNACGISFSQYLITGQLHFFMLGFLLADFHLCHPPDHLQKTAMWDMVGLAALCCIPFAYTSKNLGSLLFPVVVFIFYSSVFRGKIIRHVFTRPIICAIGGMCYSIYLLHVPVINVWFAVARRWRFSNDYLLNLLVEYSIMLPLILVISTVFYLAIEKPCMNKNWPRQFTSWLRNKKLLSERI